jgi:hypothetical protein
MPPEPEIINSWPNEPEAIAYVPCDAKEWIQRYEALGFTE